MKINGHILQQELVKFMKSRLIMIRNVELILCLIDVNDSTCRFIIDSSDFKAQVSLSNFIFLPANFQSMKVKSKLLMMNVKSYVLVYLGGQDCFQPV